jgi:HK97 gp10 family phage protein
MADVYFANREKLKKKMELLPDAFKATAIEALTKSANDMVGMMKRLAPFEDGDLLESIGWTFGDPPKGSIVVFKTKPVKAAGNIRLTVFAGNDKAFYARWVEFGTAPHAVGKGSDVSVKNKRKQFGAIHPGSRAQPFFYPSIRANVKKLKSRLSRSLNKEAKRIAAL